MITITTKKELLDYLNSKLIKSVGFVPTMGALHQGHLTLLKRAVEENEVAVVSIFINPTQFNDEKDFISYPRNHTEDSHLLKQNGCEILFLPEYEEIYPGNEIKWIEEDLGHIERVMEGKYRPGHFKGVKTVVFNLFEIVKPTKAYFGKKDYQQLLIIKSMVEKLKLPIEIVPCDTARDVDGLARSSRNKNLNKNERETAGQIPLILKDALSKLKTDSIGSVESWAKDRFNRIPDLQVEYFEILNQETLLKEGEARPGITRIFVAVKVGNTRLLDNMLFKG